MAEFVEKRCEDMILELEQMERIKLFDKNEVRGIAKNRKEHEYKIERHTKCKEDYLRYIQYEMDLLKLVKQRREKLGITQKKSSIDYAIANRVNRLYKQAIYRFQDDVRFWIAYMKFCKNVGFQSSLGRMLGKMLQIHQDKPKCWHIAAQWEIEESKDLQNARQLLLRGLHFHPSSSLLFIDMYKLELKEALLKQSQGSKTEELPTGEDGEIPKEWKRVHVVYEQAFKMVKDIKFVIELLNVTKEFENTESLQNKIVNDMVKEYSNEPLLWDTMARRELLETSSTNNAAMEVDCAEVSSLRDRILSCNEIFQVAVKKLRNEEIWSLYIDCLLDLNQENQSLPNLKRKLLKTALSQAHQAKNLKEQHYLYWIKMLSNDKKDENTQTKLAQVLAWSTESYPQSEKLWHLRLSYLLTTNNEDQSNELFKQATEQLGEKSLSLWKMKLLHVQAKNPEKIQEFFQAALLGPQNVAKDMKPLYLEWAVLTKNITETRKIYNSITQQPPFSYELHKKMIEIENMQSKISLQYTRNAYELAIMQFGKNRTDLWLDYTIFEMKHGDPLKAAEIHARAVKTLYAKLTDKFIADYTLLKANPESKSTSRN
ncbi:U3 small nucleolar RNA-associated protein 6 homolog [Leptopilina heterotoma]|uniref:U3 small nucleolar RNA-associated protein 6 homolog n=1 Tax=Leptopilina heterotoma TaxID=63436 RepID=UPI001CA82648|nr:U3 small nucleolar RNA-associated protein 6 homolog [Leptopilina heterotoma]